ncbi:MAG TPA: dynamin family protein, partial [Urbifossiella sp.]|nr:dynamin family protein [Urbifossiella sp.]
MNTWSEAAAHYVARLDKVLAVRRRALDLAALPQAGVPTATTAQLEALGGPLERQYERLRKNEFRIAVVGLENAGKSTFVNAWLGCDLLPNESHRCTYTTTQVFSVGDGQEQRLEVSAKSREQYEGMIRDLERQAAAGGGELAAKARNDLDTIRRHRASIEEVLRQGEVRRAFTHLQDVASELRRYVADERYAYGVLEVRLYTTALAAVDGVAFYDVPGLNSGLTIHETQAEQMLADCDAVILVQRVGNPSIEGSEQKLIRFVQEGDERVKVADKLFVFLGRADQEGTPAILQENRAKAVDEWQRRGQLPEDRVVVGSAAAYLVLRGVAGGHLGKALDPAEVGRKMALLTGATDDAAVLEATGVDAIKRRIDRYLQTERVDVLRRRCDDPIRETVAAAQAAYDHVRKTFSEDPAEAQRQLDADRRIHFQRWWEGEWTEISARLSNYFRGRAVRQADQKADPFRERYAGLISALVANLPSRTAAARDRLFDSCSHPVFKPSEANHGWRTRLYQEVMDLIDRASGELAAELKADAGELVEFLQNELLYGSASVGRILVGDDRDFLSLLQGKLQTLFLRFARPVVEALVRLPVADPARRELLARLGPDIAL